MILIVTDNEVIKGLKHPDLEIWVEGNNIRVINCAGKKLIVYPGTKDNIIDFVIDYKGKPKGLKI